MNLTLNMRFIGSSRALLTPAYGDGITCYIEALCVDRPTGWDEFSAELVAEWMKIPGALPHWAKEFEHVPGIVPLIRERLGDRRRRFVAALEATGMDTRHAFANPLLRRVLLDETDAVSSSRSDLVSRVDSERGMALNSAQSEAAALSPDNHQPAN
jgi:hypothetical protein